MLKLKEDKQYLPAYTIIWPGGINDIWRVHKMKFHISRDWCELLVQECIKRNLSPELYNALMEVSTFGFDASVEDLSRVALEILEGIHDSFHASVKDLSRSALEILKENYDS